MAFGKKRQIKLFIFLIVLSLSFFRLTCEEKTIILGGEKGWNDKIQTSSNLTLGKGRFGYDSLQLNTSAHKIDGYTDLYLSFENPEITSIEDETGNYSVEDNALFYTENSIVGKSAGLSRGKKPLLVMSGKKGSLFGEIGETGSFTIEFWLNPAVCASGESIFFWRSSRNLNQYSDYQTIEALIMNGKVEWKFQNIFMDAYNRQYDIYLKSASTIVPEKWARHTIIYNDEEGTIEYLIDGIIEAIAYTTDSGNAYGHFLIPDLGTPAKIEICKDFVGAIDEFVISRTPLTKEENHIYPVEGGKFTSLPLDTGNHGSILTSVETLQLIPSQTDVQFFVRGGDNYFEWDEFYPKWIPVEKGLPKEKIAGRYFQISSNLYTDGDGSKTPVLSKITLTYEPITSPFPPSKVITESGDGKVKLSWIGNNVDNKYGYIVYYGTKSGEYIGQGSDQGDSPIDCGNGNSIEITGLKNGRIYYFTVAAYLKEYPDIIGDFSEEVYARPLLQGDR